MTLGSPSVDLPVAELRRYRALAEEAARRGAAVIRRHWTAAAERDADLQVKGAGDYVTAVDRESEEEILAFLAQTSPDVPVLSEEAGGRAGDVHWAVDPLDATTNFVIGFPVVAVSVALVAGGRPAAAAVTAPILRLSFAAARSEGTWSGNRRIRVSRRPPSRAIVATALPFRARHRLPEYLSAAERIFPAVEDLRRAGSAALDLAWVAEGVWDGYFELNLGRWDVAAGALLVEEAGGVVTDWSGGPGYLEGDVVAGSPQTHAVLLSATRAEEGGPGR